MKKLFSINHNRNGAIDIYRLIFAFAIMNVHLFDPNIPFAQGGIYVEFFFMLTGALTARKINSKDYPTSFAVDYTFSKFKRFIPYVFFATLIQYTSEFYSFVHLQGYFSINDLLDFLEQFICDNLLLFSTGIPSHINPIWYLSAMFVVFPVFVCILIKFGKEPLFYKYLSWLIPALYFGKFDINVAMAVPEHILRAFSNLCLGVFAYWISTEISKNNSKHISIMSSAASFIAAIATVTITYFNTGNDYINIFCFIVLISCLLSGKCYSEKLHLPGIAGELSLAIFLFQWSVLVFLSASNMFSFKKYYVFTFIVSIVAILFVNIVGDLLNKKKLGNTV